MRILKPHKDSKIIEAPLGEVELEEQKVMLN